MTSADRVWNRAALEGGGASPGPGDRALASLLLVHGLVINGGVHHATLCKLGFAYSLMRINLCSLSLVGDEIDSARQLQRKEI